MKPQLSITLTRAQFEAARAKCAQKGVQFIGDSGDVEGHKVGIAFDFQEPTLHLTIEHKPIYYPEADVENEIRNWFAAL